MNFFQEKGKNTDYIDNASNASPFNISLLSFEEDSLTFQNEFELSKSSCMSYSILSQSMAVCEPAAKFSSSVVLDNALTTSNSDLATLPLINDDFNQSLSDKLLDLYQMQSNCKAQRSPLPSKIEFSEHDEWFSSSLSNFSTIYTSYPVSSQSMDANQS